VNIADGKWQYVQFTPDKQNILWLDQGSKLYWGVEQKRVETSELLEPTLLSGRAFNLKKRGENWFWFDTNRDYSLMIYSEQDKTSQPILPSNIYHFDVFENKILYGQTTSANTDIYQTQSLAN